jgi:hypothetical protein
MVSVVELRDYLDFAAQTAYEAGRLTLGYFQTDTLRGDWSGNETIYAGEALSTTSTLLPEVLYLIRGRTDEGRGIFPAPQT